MTGDPTEPDPEAGESSAPDESHPDDEQSPADDPFGNPYPEADREDPFGDPYPESNRSPVQSEADQAPEQDNQDAVSDGSGVDATSPRGENQRRDGPASGPRSDERRTNRRGRRQPPRENATKHDRPNDQDWTARLGNQRQRNPGRAPDRPRQGRQRRQLGDQDSGFERSWSAGGSRGGRQGRRGFEREPRQTAHGNTSSDRGNPASESQMSTVFSELRAIESSAPDQNVTKPYLQRIPDGYDAELSVMEWIRALVETGGYDATLDALAYYESIGWISTGVQHTLEEHAATIAGSTSGGDRTLTLDDHRRSLRAIARIARSGA